MALPFTQEGLINEIQSNLEIPTQILPNLGDLFSFSILGLANILFTFSLHILLGILILFGIYGVFLLIIRINPDLYQKSNKVSWFNKKTKSSSPNISKFTENESREIMQMQNILEDSEQVILVATQSRVMPGGSIITPKTVFATEKRILFRDPKLLGIRAEIDSIPYSQINNVKLFDGAVTSKIKIESGNFNTDDKGFINAIPKEKAAVLIGIINKNLTAAQNFRS